MNAANNVRRSENEGESDEITEQNPRQQDVRQLATRRANYRRVVVLEKHAADEQRYLFDTEKQFSLVSRLERRIESEMPCFLIFFSEKSREGRK